MLNHIGEFFVTVKRVVDGDTFYGESVVFDYGDFSVTIKEPKFRLIGIDTPERNEYGYSQATSFTKDELDGKEVLVKSHGKDVFGRYLVDVFVDGQEESLNDELLDEGLAEIYKR